MTVFFGSLDPVASALANPSQGATISTYHPPLRERIADAAASVAGALGAGRYTQQAVSSKVADLLDFVPGVGEAVGADEAAHSLERGDYVGAGIGGAALLASAIPLVGGPMAKAIRAAGKERGFAGKAAKILESRSARIYNPIAKPARDFALDHPAGGIADDAGRLQFDIDGNPLGAQFVAGRGMVGQPDRPVGLDGLVAAGTSLTRDGISRVAPGDIRGHAGVATFDKYSRAPLGIRLSSALDETKAQRVLAHEVGHVIDELAGQIPTDGLSRELAGVYNTLNTGVERATKLTGPKHLGYKGEDIPREYMAEAIRAYMADPNYLKTVAPKTAARIRQTVNVNPRINKTIQFNSPVAAALAAGGLGVAAVSQQGAAPAPPQQKEIW